MHNNYYFLSWLVRTLRPQLEGAFIREIYSQDKDVLIIGYQAQGPLRWIKAHLKGDFACLTFPDTLKRARRNSVDLLKALIGLKVIKVQMVKNDRSFYLDLEGNQKLLFKMHGNRSNILRLDGRNVEELFKNSMIRDRDIKLDELEKPDLTPDALEHQDLSRAFPILGKEVIARVKDSGWDSLDPDNRWEKLEKIIHQLNDLQKIYVSKTQKGYVLTLEESPNATPYDNPQTALNVFFTKFLTEKNFAIKRQKFLTEINQQIKKTHTYIQKTRNQLKKISDGYSDAEKADLIMANLHLFENKAGEIWLDKFDGSGSVAIQLKQGQSAVGLAQSLYRKSKNRKIEIDTARKNIAMKESLLESLLVQKDRIEVAETMDDMEEISVDKKKKSQIELKSEFLEYSFEGFTIRVGRNARNNDKLTFQNGYKEDLWLHAKDARGSHVLIKYRSGQPFSSIVIEKAAQLAAWFSKRKTEALVPVIYTPRKFVRKRKGDPAGAVVVEREKVILVNPENW